MILPPYLAHLDLVEHTPTLVETASALFCPAGCHRYALTRVWDPSRPVVAWIMLNPSVADAFRSDATVTRCRVRGEQWMAGGLIVLNAYAQRSTDPAALRRHPDPVGVDNDAVFRWLLGPDRPWTVGRVIVGWGSDQTLVRSGRDRQVLDLLDGLGVRPMCLKHTATGHPQHPLYVGYQHEPVVYQP